MLVDKFPDRELPVATFVRARRKAGRLTQMQLGELAGVGKRFIVELEQGKPTLRMDKVNHVLAVFGRQLGPVDPRRPNPLAGGPADAVKDLGAADVGEGRGTPPGSTR